MAESGPPSSTEATADRPDDARDVDLLDALHSMWEHADPPADDLAERMLFAVLVENLDAELMVLEQQSELAAVRGEAPVRTFTFSGERCTVMVTLTRGSDERTRLDGWVAPPLGGRLVARRSGGWEQDSPVDLDGRFRLDDVPVGALAVVYHPEPVAGVVTRPLASPLLSI